MQSERNVCIFGRVGTRLLKIDLIKGQLLSTFTGDLFETDRLVVQVMQAQGVHVMAGADTIKYVRCQHGVI